MHLPRTIYALLGLVASFTVPACSGGGSSVPHSVAAPVAYAAAQRAQLPSGAVLRAATFGMPGRNLMQLNTGPYGFSAMTVDFSHNGIADDGTVIASFAKRYGVDTIFLRVAGYDIVQLESRNPLTRANLDAMFDVAKVYVLTGDPSWLALPGTVPSDADAIVRRIAPLYPRFAGILYDIEPDRTQEPAYFRLLDTLLGGPHPYAFGTTILETNPTWWRHPNRNGGPSPSMLQAAESYRAVAQTYLQMNGGSAASQMTHDVTKALPQLEKPYWSGANAETLHGNSYDGVTPSYLASNLTQVASRVRALNPSLAGVSVDEWDDEYGALESILPQPTPAPIPQPTGPLVPAVGRGYLGAFVNPNKLGLGPEIVAAFEASIGRKLAYDLHFRGWSKPFVDRDLHDDAAKGRVPLVALDCGAPDARVAAGGEDAQIRTSARAAAAYGNPIFLRFFWEMNLPAKQVRLKCYDPATDLPDNKFSPVHFIAAWRRMHRLFAEEGAKNVIWVWNESGGGPTPAQYYPGDDVVDWVGVDDYDRESIPFLANFAPLLNSTAQYRKPIMICETGALAHYQARYFEQIVDAIPADYPLVKAFSYFDGAGGLLGGNWTIVGRGLDSFTRLGQKPAFSAFAPL